AACSAGRILTLRVAAAVLEPVTLSQSVARSTSRQHSVHSSEIRSPANVKVAIIARRCRSYLDNACQIEALLDAAGELDAEAPKGRRHAFAREFVEGGHLRRRLDAGAVRPHRGSATRAHASSRAQGCRSEVRRC